MWGISEQCQEETFEGDGHVRYLDHGDASTGVNISKLIKVGILSMHNLLDANYI